MSRLRLITVAEASSCRCIGRVPRHLVQQAPHRALAARTDRRGALASLDTVRETLGDWTVSPACVEHSAYADSTAGPRTMSLQPPG